MSFISETSSCSHLLLTPGRTSRKSSVLTAPSLTPSSCSVPTYPLTGKFRGSMAGMIVESMVICEGRDNDEFSSACYKLISNRWKQMPSLKEKRAYGSSVVFPNGSL